jgi:hypothetical protein
MFKTSTDFIQFRFSFAPENYGIVTVRQAYAYVQGDFILGPTLFYALLYEGYLINNAQGGSTAE